MLLSFGGEVFWCQCHIKVFIFIGKETLLIETFSVYHQCWRLFTMCQSAIWPPADIAPSSSIASQLPCWVFYVFVFGRWAGFITNKSEIWQPTTAQRRHWPLLHLNKHILIFRLLLILTPSKCIIVLIYQNDHPHLIFQSARKSTTKTTVIRISKVRMVTTQILG